MGARHLRQERGPGDIAAGAAGTAGTEDVARPDTPDSLCGWIDDDTNLHVWENLGVRGVWERYVDDWCRACESSLNFDVMAHPDLQGLRLWLLGTLDAHGLYERYGFQKLTDTEVGKRFMVIRNPDAYARTAGVS